jgi:hypothetical protein
MTATKRMGRPRIRGPRLAIAAAAATAVASCVIGLGQLGGHGRIGDVVRPSSTHRPALGRSGRDATDPDLPSLGIIEPGRYVAPAPGMAVHLTVPAGWLGITAGLGKFAGSGRGDLALVVPPSEVAYVIADACRDGAEVAFDPVGQRVMDLMLALAAQVGVSRSGPTDVTVGGYPAKRFTVTLDPSCPGADRRGVWADAMRRYTFWLEPGETGIVDVVDVEGHPLVITSRYGAEASAEGIAELEAIAASIGIEPRPGTTPTHDPGACGWLPQGRHSLTVDGVTVSFSVPAREWAFCGITEITVDSTGPDHAEAMVYWTAYTGGAHAIRCASLGLPVTASMDELADAISTAPGTMLASGPTAVTLGGHPARQVVITVREDRGCDPKFFFSSKPPRGGPGWWRTDAGDTLRVWIVDVDGASLIIVGASKPAAGTDLEQEIEDIVGSIRFE